MSTDDDNLWEKDNEDNDDYEMKKKEPKTIRKQM